MDDAHRDTLARKRALLKLRLARAEASRTFRAIAPQVRAAGVRFAKLSLADVARAFAPWQNHPARDERLYWPEIPGGLCQPWSSPAERDALITSALAVLAQPDARIAVIWHTAESGLRLCAQSLPAVIPILCDALHEGFWLVPDADSAWLIEVSLRDCEMCWVRAD
jgi:hypothetical protein